MRFVLALFTCVVLAACMGSDRGDSTESGGGLDKEVKETIVAVVTLQSGTISELKDRRGTGPFTTFDRSPDEMVEILERAARKARGLGDKPVRAIFVSESLRSVLAKERTAEESESDSYEPVFRSAMIAYVHVVPGRSDQSRVEVHAIQRGPFHEGAVNWERDMPRWIKEAMADDEKRPTDIAPIR